MLLGILCWDCAIHGEMGWRQHHGDTVIPWDRAKDRSTRTFLLGQGLIKAPVMVEGTGDE